MIHTPLDQKGQHPLPMNDAGAHGRSTIVIIACGKAKVWGRRPEAGAVAARETYTGYPFRVNRAYAEAFAGRWFILSAKYGLLLPDDTVDGPYDVSFLQRRSGPVAADVVREQAVHYGLFNQPGTVVGLGGKAYREVIEAAFAGSQAELRFPFAGLGLGKMVKATRAAIEAGDPFPTIDM